MSIKVGIVGIGFMGWIHWLAWKQIEGAEVVAICETDPAKRSGDWTSIKGNFGPTGEHVDLTGVQIYDSVEQLIADESIDLVDICLPPAMHVDAIIAAASCGKNVFSEKPLSLHLSDCDKALAACKDNKVRLFVGHVLPFFIEFGFVTELVHSRKYGKLIGGNFKRVISDPFWLSNFYDREKIGGPLLDLHVHDAHLIRMLFGLPKTVYSCGRLRDSVPEYFNSVFTFEDSGVSACCTGGIIHQQGRPFNHGFEIHLEKATVCFEFAAHSDAADIIALKVLTDRDEVIRPVDLGDPDPVFAFVRELEEVTKCLNNDRDSELLAGNLARDAIAICEAEEVSMKSGAIVAL